MPRSLEDMVVRLDRWVRGHYFGKYRGKVAEIGEDDRLGQIKAEVPEVFGEELSPWARPSVPFAGNGHGWVSLPEEDDGVWIEFEAGDRNKPIWSGFWWAADELPEAADTRVRLLATSAGHQLIFDEDAGEVTLEHGDGPSLVMTANDITLKVGSKQIVISASGVDVNQGALEVK